MNRFTVFFQAALVVLALFSPLSAATINFNVDAGAAGTTIIPLSYGANQDPGVPEIPFFRQGGNRMTGYNWEQNASNAGSDYIHSSDSFLLSQMSPAPPGDLNQMPATVVVQFVNKNKARGAESLVTLQLAGYVAADMNGTVTTGEVAPSARWKGVAFTKGSAFVTPPDKTDGAVYMDEFVDYMMNTVGTASAGGVKYYNLDNEPALWRNTHARIHPLAPTYAEVMGKGVTVATMVTALDPAAEIFGPVCYGWSEFVNLQSAPDRNSWNSYNNGNGITYLNFYLDQFRLASNTAGRRLLHFLDVHWYPEATGSNGVSQVRITNNDVTQGVAIARMQAPRSLWDPTYVEYSWITGNGSGAPITLIPRLAAAVSQYYPGTRLSISEYNYGAANDVSGGIAHADALGILGKYGVSGHWWSLGGGSAFVRAAYRLYLNYDGAGAKFGDLSLPATSDSVTLSSVYGAKSTSNPLKLWVVALNKDYSNANTGNFNLNNLAPDLQISTIRSFRFAPGASTLASPPAPAIFTSSFVDTLPARSGTIYEVNFVVATPTATPTPCMVGGNTCTPTETPTPTDTPTPTATPTFTATPSNLYTVFPNPWPDPNNPGASFSIYYENDQAADEVKLKIYTLAFRKIYEDNGLPNTQGAQPPRSVNLADLNLANGLYYVVLSWKRGDTETRKVMKLLIQR